MITHEQARQLLDKYFAGESSLDEEQQLRHYYTVVDQCPDDLAPYAELFHFFAAEAAVATSPAWERKLARPPAARARRIRMWWAVAATITLILTATLTWWQQAPPQLATTEETIDWSKYEVKDPTEALRIAHGALRRTSVALQQSTRRATEEVRQVHKILPNFK